jgi:hypothetical protein
MFNLQVRAQLAEQGVGEDTATRILQVMGCRSLAALRETLGPCSALADLEQLFALAEGYGFAQWLECDASVVRGLAYYTGASDLVTFRGRFWQARVRTGQSAPERAHWHLRGSSHHMHVLRAWGGVGVKSALDW